MENIVTRHPALAALAALSLAGTCLAAPGLALAATGSLADIAASAASAAAEDANAAEIGEAATTEVESQFLAQGGVQVSVPGSYTVSNDDGYPLAVNADETVAVAVIDMELDAEHLALIPEDQDEVLLTLADLAQQSVESLDGTVVDSTTLQIGDGAAVAYCYGISCTDEDGTPTFLAEYFVVTDKALVLVQIACAEDVIDELADELSAIEDSIAPCDALAGTVYEVGGLAITIPDDTFELDGEATDTEATWFATDGEAMISVMGDLGTGETIDAAYFDALADELIAELDGTPENTTVLTNGDLEMTLYGFTIEDDGTTYYGAIGLANTSDDCLTAILVLTGEDIDIPLNDAIEAILLEIALA
jgi:hypothetical protein